MTPELLTPLRELGRRQTNGVDVRLPWCEADGGVLVAVNDHEPGRPSRSRSRRVNGRWRWTAVLAG